MPNRKYTINILDLRKKSGDTVPLSIIYTEWCDKIANFSQDLGTKIKTTLWL